MHQSKESGLGRWWCEGRQGEHDLKTVRGTIPHVRSGNGTTAVLRLQCFPRIAVTPSPPYVHALQPSAPWPFRVTRKFSLPRAMQFRINYASGCPWRAVGRRIILRQFTPPRPKEAANKPASISRHAIPLPTYGTHGVWN